MFEVDSCKIIIVREFVFVDDFVGIFKLILSCGVRNSFVYCGSLRGVRKMGLLALR